MAEEFSYDGLQCIRHINRQKAEGSLGTLGGGNHFIELDRGTEGSNAKAYSEDVQIIQRYAEWNREIIVREILKGMKWKALEQFSVPHNYLDPMGILRKGAVSAGNGEKVIIPANMKEGIILGIGKGNAEWNCSAPHGSGRRRKREDVKSKYIARVKK